LFLPQNQIKLLFFVLYNKIRIYAEYLLGSTGQRQAGLMSWSCVCRACVRPRVNFSFKHLLNYRSNSDEISQECSWVNLFQICSNYAPGVKFDPAPGVTKLKICLYKAYFVKTFKILLSITIEPRAI